MRTPATALLAMTLGGCSSYDVTFGDDLAFLRAHTEIVLLSDDAGRAQVAIAPEYQGRVMTSTLAGRPGMSQGWINRDVIASGTRQERINVFGGEDRFWLGPEGGQHGLYFDPGDPFDLDHWRVPEPIDFGAWETLEVTPATAAFSRICSVVNYIGTRFDMRLGRIVRLIDPGELDLARGLAAVAYESRNTVTNLGAAAWRKDDGLVSIWILSMLPPSPRTTVVIPFEPAPGTTAGEIVNDAYFGTVPPERLLVDTGRGVLFFRADGAQRGKIGVRRRWARPALGAYDAANRVLTIVEFTLPEPAREYVDSTWAFQEDPYDGDVANAYNDGPPAPGVAPLGPFYELESSSPALALAPGQTAEHVHRVMHVQGAPGPLDALARAKLGVGIDEIESVFAFD